MASIKKRPDGRCRVRYRDTACCAAALSGPRRIGYHHSESSLDSPRVIDSRWLPVEDRVCAGETPPQTVEHRWQLSDVLRTICGLRITKIPFPSFA
jgi:hypothetical protein